MNKDRKILILFNIKANQREGLGHFYRCSSLAKELKEAQIGFVCSYEDRKFIANILDKKFKLHSYIKSDPFPKIKKLKPNVLINDVLSTDKSFIKQLINEGIKVINFEDLGSGAEHTNLTINEIYEDKLVKGNNILWGSEYFFLREEFDNKLITKESIEIDSLLLTFGGSDQHNLSKKIYSSIKEFCQKESIFITIVTGPAYCSQNLKELKELVQSDSGVDLISSTGSMASIMEKTKFAISSNGRTVYELAHMNVPAIVISQHARESMHTFANENNGFINLGIYSKGKTEKEVLNSLVKITNSQNIKRKLHNAISNISFKGNKKRVLKLIRDEF